jgi:hypothetical protein
MPASASCSPVISSAAIRKLARTLSVVGLPKTGTEMSIAEVMPQSRIAVLRQTRIAGLCAPVSGD